MENYNVAGTNEKERRKLLSNADMQGELDLLDIPVDLVVID